MVDRRSDMVYCTGKGRLAFLFDACEAVFGLRRAFRFFCNSYPGLMAPHFSPRCAFCSAYHWLYDSRAALILFDIHFIIMWTNGNFWLLTFCLRVGGDHGVNA